MEWNRTIEVCKQYAEEVIALYRQKLVDNPKSQYGDKNTTGNLSNNLDYEVIVSDDEVKVLLYIEDYWKYVEEGRMKGSWPPVNKIEQWIETKPVLPQPNSNGKLPTIKQLAFLISRSIYEHGIEPTYYLSESIEELGDKYKSLFETALEEDAADIALVLFDTLLDF